ncbi:aldehyde dehydrogenase family protein [cyanobacterium endosymbiont of Rhopalodia gibberula]
MKASAKYMTPVTLELGGNSPCIVDDNINADCAAKRIA